MSTKLEIVSSVNTVKYNLTNHYDAPVGVFVNLNLTV